MLESEKADTRRLGEPPPIFAAGSEWTMRTSNMGIQSAASFSHQATGTVGTQSASQDTASTQDDSPPRPLSLRRIDDSGGAVPGSQDTELAERAARSMVIDDGGHTDSREVERRRARTYRAAPVAAPANADGATTQPGPYATGSCRCPWCPGTSFATPGGLMRHITTQHEGTAMDATIVETLRGLDRAVCTGPGCGCIRHVGSRQCHRCGDTTVRANGRGTVTLRPLAVGDVIPGGRGVPLRPP